MNKQLPNGLKLLAAGGTIAMVAFAIATMSPRGGVRDSNADVLDFDFFRTTPSVRFVESLEQLGHEEPRVYEVGEETVYFSARTTSRRPHELVEEYQRTFVENGVNAEAHVEPMSPLSPDARQMLRGEVVTFEANANFASMGGGVIAGLPETKPELERELAANRDVPFDQVFRGFRSIQAERLDGMTVVTAVWSDDDFDIRESLNPGPADTEVPACPGCITLPDFGTVANDIDRTVHHLESPQRPEDVQRFYRRAFTNRGWTETETSRHGSGEPREYTRGEERMTVFTRPHEDGTSVTLIRGD